MIRLRYYSMVLWLLLRSIPPVSPGRLTMPVVFLSSWTVLRGLAFNETLAFVWAGVLAQFAQVWGVLPVSLWHQRRLFGRARPGGWYAISFALAAFGVQVFWADPVVSQRFVTAYGGLYIAIMVWGISGDRVVLDRFAPVPDQSKVSQAFRRHLLKLYALVAFLVIVVNETLLAMAAPLAARVAVLARLPIALHVFFETALRLTAPLGEDS
ncbi:hypothetical protein [Marimonas lutisalis]|uniref:hypothetical protein n=1 Tax=Marimonas lutisalis TaxID=2545756 RepID=UPI0010F9AE53|nr:hypothetical protein [Marimonas lutisalis]